MTDNSENTISSESLNMIQRSEENGTLEFLHSPEAYQILSQIVTSSGKEFPCNYSTYVDSLEELGIPATDKSKLLGYVINPQGAAGIAQAMGGVNQILKGQGIDVGQTIKETVVRSAAELREQARKFAQKTATNEFQRFAGGTGSGGGDGNTSKADFQGGSSWNPTGMSLKNKPMETEFSTDIRFIGADKYYLDGKEENTPLLMKCGIPGLVDFTRHTPGFSFTEDLMLEDYYHTIVGQYRKAISQRVTYSNQVTGMFTNESLTKKFNRDLQSVCTYYFWMSVIAYTDNPKNKNKAMYELRNSLSATDMNKLYILERSILQAVIPPFIHKWCFYIMGNYKQSYMPGAPLIKILPWFMQTSSVDNVLADTNALRFMGKAEISSGITGNAPTFVGPIENAILLMDQNRPLDNVLSASFPDWCEQQLYGYDSLPGFSNDYLDCWTNGMYLGLHSHAGGFFQEILLPRVENGNDAITYCNSTDAPDGWTQAMQAIDYHQDSASQQTLGPGLFKPSIVIAANSVDSEEFTEQVIRPSYSLYRTQSAIHPPQTANCSCLIYDGEFGSVEGFFDVSSRQPFQAVSRNTYSTTLSSNTYTHHQKFGTSIMSLQSADVIRQSVMLWLDLYADDLLKAGPSKNNDKNRSRSSGKKDYRKGKTRKSDEAEEKEM